MHCSGISAKKVLILRATIFRFITQPTIEPNKIDKWIMVAHSRATKEFVTPTIRLIIGETAEETLQMRTNHNMLHNFLYM